MSVPKITKEKVNRIWKKYAIDNVPIESRGRSPIADIDCCPGRQYRTKKSPDYTQDWSNEGR
jgi:hypothetical protein